MTTLNEILGDPKRCGVFRFSGAASTINSAATAAGLALYQLDIGNLRGKNGLLEALARTLEFPASFGMNWDALDECLRDLEWIKARGWVLIMANSAQFALKNRRILATAIEVLRSAAEYWSREGKPFWVIVLMDAKSRYPELPQLPAARGATRFLLDK